MGLWKSNRGRGGNLGMVGCGRGDPGGEVRGRRAVEVESAKNTAKR